MARTPQQRHLALQLQGEKRLRLVENSRHFFLRNAVVLYVEESKILARLWLLLLLLLSIPGDHGGDCGVEGSEVKEWGNNARERGDRKNFLRM